MTGPPEGPPGRRPLAPVLAPAVLLVGLLVNRWPGFLSPIEWSHLQATLALVDRGTFEVSAEVAALGRHADLSQHAGRIYSNKAPGLSWLSAPAVAAVRVAERVSGRRASLGLLLWSSRTLACLVPLALFVPWFARERRRRGDPAGTADLAAAALLLGTPALVYADLLTAQLPAGLAAYAAASSLLDRRFVRAGLAAGAAVLLQYPLALVAVAFSAAAPFLPRAADARARGRALLGIGLGAALPAALLMAYDTLCFGGPLQLSSLHESLPEYQQLARGGAAGIAWPRADALYGLLLSPSRGLFFFAPVLLAAAAGAVALLRSRERRAEGVLLLLGAGLPILAFSGYENWHGGSSFGPRYLVPTLPFLAAFVSATPLPERPRARAGVLATLAGLALAGFAQTLAGLVSFPNVPYAIGDPGSNAIQNFCLPLLLQAGRAPTWLDGTGLSGAAMTLSLLLGLAAAAGLVALAVRAAPRGQGLVTGAGAIGIGLLLLSLLASAGTGENDARVTLRRLYAPHVVPWAVVSSRVMKDPEGPRSERRGAAFEASATKGDAVAIIEELQRRRRPLAAGTRRAPRDCGRSRRCEALSGEPTPAIRASRLDLAAQAPGARPLPVVHRPARM